MLEEAAVGDAADHRETGLLRFQRQCRRGHDVPHREWPLQVRVTAVTLIVGQTEFAAREIADSDDAFELLFKCGVGIGPRKKIIDGIGAPENGVVATDGVAVIVERGAASDVQKYDG